jgi:hypothetical protein
MLCCLPTHQCAPGLAAPFGDAFDDAGDPLRVDLATGDVVGQEQRLGATDDQVVDHHADQVDAYRVVEVHRLGDRDLGADSVGGCRQDGMGHGPQPAGVEESGKSAETGEYFRPTGRIHPVLHQFDRPLPRCDVHPSGGVRALLTHGSHPLTS